MEIYVYVYIIVTLYMFRKAIGTYDNAWQNAVFPPKKSHLKKRLI